MTPELCAGGLGRGGRGGLAGRSGEDRPGLQAEDEDSVNKSVLSRVVKVHLEPSRRLPVGLTDYVQEVKSREETMEEQKTDTKSAARNKRMFGSLLGTLKKFTKEEVQKKDVVDKKKLVEKKVEEKTEKEKEEIKTKKRELFYEHKKKKKDIQIIQIQMKRVEEYETWESSKKKEVNFIRTKGTPPGLPEIFWLPKKHTEGTQALLVESKETIEKQIEERKEEFEAELLSIEKKMTADLERRNVGMADLRNTLDKVKPWL